MELLIRPSEKSLERKGLIRTNSKNWIKDFIISDSKRFVFRKDIYMVVKKSKDKKDKISVILLILSNDCVPLFG